MYFHECLIGKNNITIEGQVLSKNYLPKLLHKVVAIEDGVTCEDLISYIDENKTFFNIMFYEYLNDDFLYDVKKYFNKQSSKESAINVYFEKRIISIKGNLQVNNDLLGDFGKEELMALDLCEISRWIKSPLKLNDCNVFYCAKSGEKEEYKSDIQYTVFELFHTLLNVISIFGDQDSKMCIIEDLRKYEKQ